MNISDFKGYFDLDLLYKERWNLEESKISGRNHCSEYFDLGYSCAEASFMAICDMLEVEDGPNSCVATCFGGGMGRNNLICGAISGCLMGIGVKLNRTSPTQSELKELAYSISKEYISTFEKENGSLYCTELCGCNMSTQDGLARYNDEKVHFTFCKPMVEKAVETAFDITNRNVNV